MCAHGPTTVATCVFSEADCSSAVAGSGTFLSNTDGSSVGNNSKQKMSLYRNSQAPDAPILANNKLNVSKPVIMRGYRMHFLAKINWPKVNETKSFRYRHGGRKDDQLDVQALVQGHPCIAGRPVRARHGYACVSLLAMVGFLHACTTAPLVQGGGLSSYDAMKPSDGLMTKSRVNVNKQQVLAAKTVNILPTAFPPTVAPKLSNQQRALVANAVSRALCVDLSDRFRVVRPDEPADLTVRASVTQVKETNAIAAGLSAATSLGTSFIDMGTSVPIPIPRIPIGLGNLSIEAEAIDPLGQQQAAMLWAKGATTFFSSPKASKVSDAYDLADAFADDFSDLLVKGRSPFGSKGIDFPDIPSWHKIKSAMGRAPKYAACENYGRSPGVKGMIGEQLGLPPEWTDRGAGKAGR